MNRNHNNERRNPEAQRVQRNGSPPVNRPHGNVRQSPQRRPDMRRPEPVPGANGRPPMTPQQPKPQKNSGLARLAIIWIAVLAVVLAVILIVAITTGRIGGDSDESLPAAAGVSHSDTTEITTTEETFPVSHAVTDDETTGFAADLDFTHGILIDVESNTVIASKDGDTRMYPASMTKIMTLIVAAESVENLDETFTMTAEITDPLYLANASVAGFLVGEEVTVRDLIYGLILPSGGDGALGLAYHIAGSEEAFAALMNEKAKELGLKNTHFTNCTGLHDDDHYTTCHEMAMILEYAIKDEFMREVLSTYQYTTEITPEHPEGILLTSTLLSRMNGDESGTVFVQGGKTGYTIEAKNCLATFATKLIPGMSEESLKAQPPKYILVTAGSGEKFGPVFAAIDIYESVGGDDGDDGVVPDVPSEEPKDTQTSKKTEAPDEKDTSDTENIKIYTAADPEN